MKILIVDDEENIRLILQNIFTDEGYQVETAKNGIEALKMIEIHMPKIVVLDKNMPQLDGLKTLEQLKAKYPNIVVIMITAHGDVESAVEAMKAGAYDYLEKPFDNHKMISLVKRAIEYYKLNTEIVALRNVLNGKFSFKNIIGNSAGLKKVLTHVASVCETDATVLVLGESGTGKELIAQAIHYNSPRKRKPLVIVNCGAIPIHLFESELFGHEKGAFTDAKETKIGKFELANGGSLFLDEVGELPLDAQVKLLRVLEEKRFTRVGGKKEILVDIRFISATNNDLLERVENNNFRLDLFYRLNIFTINIPPLRERREDIPSLIDHFIEKHNNLLKTQITGYTKEALMLLQSYSWPGNIRDMENAIQSAMILCKKGKLKQDHLPQRLNVEDVDSSEKDMLIQALEQCKYNKTEAAKILNISRKTLFNKMQKYNLMG